MQETTKAIVLKTIKYGDSSLIVKLYTASSGLKSYMLNGVLSRKKGKFNKAHFLPLSQLEIVAQHRDKGNLERLTEAKLSYPYQSAHTHMAKNAIVLFLSEFLSNAIQEETENKALFSFIETALQWLDHEDQIANFHLFFLVEISKYFGFYPSDNHLDRPYFDLVEGDFCTQPGLNPHMAEPEISFFKSILGINFDMLKDIKMSQKSRRELISHLMVYYQHHLDGFKTPKSIHILNEVFS